MTDTTLETYDDLLQAIETNDHDFDLNLIGRTYRFAESSHTGREHLSGQPHIIHSVSVACILVELGMDSESVAAGFLHDVVEDTSVGLDQIRKQFGSDTASLTDDVTKLGRIPYSLRKEQQVENIRKMLIAISEDIRVIIIKSADRLHSMCTLEYMTSQKQRDKTLENMGVYAPIVHRLGIRVIKEELENFSLRYPGPIAYQEIGNILELCKKDRNHFIETTKVLIYDRVSRMIPNVYLQGRVKSIHGIYRKVFMQGRSMDEIYDIYAVRVIVDTVNDCYNVLGIIHDMFRPLPNRFKGYISTPKPNMHQSLHTTVIGKEGIPLEVQIRTWEMHHTAGYGIAVHWKYKLGLADKGNSLENRLAWIHQMLENQKDSDATDIVRNIKSDLVPEEVFVFTPKGEATNLPVGTTAIDFAYVIHSAVGNRMTGTKVDKHIVPIDHKVKNGEIIEVLTTEEANRGPSRGWFKTVKTSEMRNKIRQQLKGERRDENIAEGRAEVERELKCNGIALAEEELKNFLLGIRRKVSYNTMGDVYAVIGYGGIQLWKNMPRLREEYLKMRKSAQTMECKQSQSPIKRAAGGILIDGMENCLVKFLCCCNPLPGDEIIGFVICDLGVSAHKWSCLNVSWNVAESPEPERWVSAHWGSGEVKEEFKSTLEIVVEVRPEPLVDLIQQMFTLCLFIHLLNSHETKDGKTTISTTITVNGIDHLAGVTSKLGRIEGILSARRSRGLGIPSRLIGRRLGS